MLSIFVLGILYINRLNNGVLITYYSNTYIKKIDPSVYTTYLADQFVRNVYESLYEYIYEDNKFKIVPLLATKMPIVSDDGLVYKIEIKKNIFYHSDPCFTTNEQTREIVAGDFVYSLYRTMSRLDSSTEYLTSLIKDIKAESKYVLRIELKNSNDLFNQYMTELFFSPIPKEAVDYYQERFNINPIGTGPFVLNRESIETNEIVLNRNDNYRTGKMPKVKTVRVKILPDKNMQEKAFKEGELDLVFSLNDYNDNKYIKRKKMINFSTHYLGFNMLSNILGNNNSNNKYLRKAIAYSINFDDLWAYRNYMSAYNAQWILPPSVFGYDPLFNNPIKKYNPKVAEKNIKQAGYKLITDIPEIQIYTYWPKKPQDLFIEESLKKSGFKIKMEYEPLDKLVNILKKGDSKIDAFILSYSTPFFESSLPFLKLLSEEEGNNFFFFHNANYDMLYEKFKKLSPLNINTKKATELIKKMRNITIDEVPLIPLFHSTQFYNYYDYVTPDINPKYSDIYKNYKVNLIKKRCVLSYIKNEGELPWYISFLCSIFDIMDD